MENVKTSEMTWAAYERCMGKLEMHTNDWSESLKRRQAEYIVRTE
jgi:hypothetical protein